MIQNKLKKITLPKGLGTSASIIDGKIVFVTIAQNPVGPDPLIARPDLGEIYARNNHVVNGLEIHGNLDLLRAKQKRYPDEAIPLSYFELSGLHHWVVQDESIKKPAKSKWDTVHLSGIWIPGEALLEELTEKDIWEEARFLKLRERAKAACHLFTTWFNHRVFCYSVSIYDTKHSEIGTYDALSDYRFDTALGQDSCDGFCNEVSARVAAQMGLKRVFTEVTRFRKKEKRSFSLKGLLRRRFSRPSLQAPDAARVG